MGARDKLNWACLNGALLFAGCAGVMTHSWGVFCIALIVAIAIGCAGGDIRPTPGGGGRIAGWPQCRGNQFRHRRHGRR
jgi:hypothetical protein